MSLAYGARLPLFPPFTTLLSPGPFLAPTVAPLPLSLSAWRQILGEEKEDEKTPAGAPSIFGYGFWPKLESEDKGKGPFFPLEE